MIDKINACINKHMTEWLEELAGLVRQRSVSGTGEGVVDCAELFVKVMRKVGIDANVRSLSREYPPFPFVVGEAKCNNLNAPTILVYGHYDVKPEGDVSLWKSEPFEPEIRDGRMYGRGVSDNKCQIFMYIKAIQICRELYGELPCNVKFIFEGSEEIGSPGLSEFLMENRELLKADFCLNSDGAMHESCRPTVKLGTKGMYAPILEVICANRDVHSMHGPTVPNAAWRMVEVLSSLRDFSTGRILIDGFYDDVQVPTEEEIATLQSMPDDGAVTLRELDLDHFAMGPKGNDYNYNFVFENSCNINSLVSGHIGPGDNNIAPHKARCRLDFRLVPNQIPLDIHEKLQAHLHKHGFDDVKIISAETAVKPVRLSITNPYVQILIPALRDAYNQEPIVYPSGGGSGPLKMFTDSVGVDTVILPMCAADQCEHSPNENMKLMDFENGIRAASIMMIRLGEKLKVNEQ